MNLKCQNFSLQIAEQGVKRLTETGTLNGYYVWPEYPAKDYVLPFTALDLCPLATVNCNCKCSTFLCSELF